jgi:DNA-binding GntR family transcriptional regulator
MTSGDEVLGMDEPMKSDVKSDVSGQAALNSGAPIPRRNLKDHIVDHVRNLILTGALRPGDRIPQDEIAESLAVSRLPVREALIALEAEGLISTQPRRGSFVSMLEPQDVVDHFAMVGLISGVAVARAATALTSEQFAELEELCDAMEQATDAEQQATFNNQFHEIINRAGSSMRLRSVLRGLSRSIPSKFFEMPTDWRTWGSHDHRAILDALRRGDGEEAARLTQEHLRHGGEAAVAGLHATGFWRR